MEYNQDSNLLAQKYPTSNDILLYKTANHLILFKEKEILKSGFALVDEKHYIILEGRKPVGIEQGTFAINPTLIRVLSPNDDYLHVRCNDSFSYRFYHIDKEYEANDGIAPNIIINSGYLKYFNYIKISNKNITEQDNNLESSIQEENKNKTLNHYKENTAFIKDVLDFHKLFNHPVLETPQIPSKERSSLRVSLIREELTELAYALDNNNIIEVADALADLQYVLCGAILEFGLGDIFYEIFQEVQRSNMSKACNTIGEALDTVAHYDAQNIEVLYVEKDGKYLIYRTSDNKVLKSINYSPANIKGILEKHGYINQ